MTDEEWNADVTRSLGMLLSGDAIEEVDERGHPVVGDSLLVLINADADGIRFTIPPLNGRQQWQRVLDTAHPDAVERLIPTGGEYMLEGRSLAVFKVPRSRALRRADDLETFAGAEPVSLVTANPVTVER
jgi:glycogen operon protein